MRAARSCGPATAMHDRPRIAIISRLYPRPYRPHIAAFNRQQFRLLAQRYAVSLLVPVPWDEWLAHRKQLAPARVDGMDIQYAGWIFPPKVGRTLYPACFGASLLPRLPWLRRLDPACVLVSWIYPDAVGAMALCRLLGKPYVIKLHGSDVNVHAVHPLHAVQARWAARHAAAVVCVSEAIKQRAIALGVPAEKLVVIHNGVDGELFFPMPRAAARVAAGVPQERRLILFVGNVLASKGVRELVAAYKQLAAARPELDLALVGDGAELAWVKAEVEAAGLAPRVHLPGRVPHDALGVWFNAADLVCLPSYNEGLPNVLLEAMACGIPCVATRVGGIPEAISEATGELVEPRDPAALAEALARALVRAWDRERITREAGRFSWDANLHARARVIDSAIAGGGAPGARPGAGR